MQRVFIAIFMAGLCLSAQQPHTYTLTGRVLDPSDAAVAGAALRLYSRDNAVAVATQSDSQGAYRFERLAAGQYLLEARTSGLDQASPVEITLSGSATLTQDVRLDVRGLVSRVLVTASNTPQSTVETSKSMDIIDGADLARRDKITLTESLRPQAGLRVQSLGGPGSTTRIQTRGLRAADTGILIDGQRFRDVASVQGDAVAFLGDLQLINTERIEVLRGLGSTVYGTNSTAGVINIVTDQGGGVPRGELSAEGGGLGVIRGLARLAGGAFKDRLQYSAGLAHLNVSGGVDGVEHVRNTSGQGYLLFRPNSTTSLSARILGGAATIGVNSSPMAAPEANLPVSGTITAIPLAADQARLADQGLPFNWGSATFGPNFFDPDSRRIGTFTSTALNWNQQLTPRWNYRVSYQAMVSDRDNRNGAAGQGYQPLYNSSDVYGGRLDTAGARSDVAIARWHLLSFGYEWERESYRSTSSDLNPDLSQRVNATATAVQRSHAVYFQDQLKFFADRLQVALSGRLQHFDLSAPSFAGGDPIYAGVQLSSPPNAFTGDVALSYYLPASSTKLRAHSGNGYRSPTLYERLGSSFFWGAFSPLGDPRLRPERSVAVDFGVDQYFANSRYKASATYFYTRLQEVIGYTGLSNDIFGRWGGYANMGGGLARGMEMSLEARPRRSLLVTASYTYTNADERDSAMVGGLLQSIRVFPHAFSFVATQQLGRRIDVSAELLAASDYVSGSFFVGSGSRPYLFAGPRRLDVALNYTLPLGESRRLKFFTRIENALNQTYYEDGFRTPQAWATAGLKLYF